MKYIIWIIYAVILLSLCIFFFYNFYFLRKTENQSLSLAEYYIQEDFDRVSRNVVLEFQEQETAFYIQLMNGQTVESKLIDRVMIIKETYTSLHLYPFFPFLFAYRIPEFLDETNTNLPESLSRTFSSTIPREEKLWLADYYLKDPTVAQTLKQTILIEKVKLLEQLEQYSEAEKTISSIEIDNWIDSEYAYAIYLLRKINIYSKIENRVSANIAEDEFLNFVYQYKSMLKQEDLEVLMFEFKKLSNKYTEHYIVRFKHQYLDNRIVYSTNNLDNLKKYHIYSDRTYGTIFIKGAKYYSTLFPVKGNQPATMYVTLCYNEQKILKYMQQRVKQSNFLDLASLNETVQYQKIIPFIPDRKLIVSQEYIKKRAVSIRNQRRNMLIIFFLVFFAALTILFFLHLSLKRERDLLKQKSNFVSAVSHELRTPLSGIKLCAETLSMGRITDQKRKQSYLERIVDQTDYLNDLLNNILDFSKMQKGKLLLNFQPASINDLLISVVEKFKLSLRTNDVNFIVDLQEDIDTVYIDYNSIIRVMINLFDNAVKYSPEEKEIILVSSQKGGFISISVSDKGMGIPIRFYKKIFKHFYRIQDEQRRSTKGTGLGLAMVDYIIHSHYGSITVTSTLHKSTTFTILLPTLEKFQALQKSQLPLISHIRRKLIQFFKQL